MVSNDTLADLSDQQRRILRAFGDDQIASSSALQQAVMGDTRPLTRSEQASLSRALRRLEQRGLLTRTARGSFELTPTGRALVHPVDHALEAARQARLEQLMADLDALERTIKSGSFRY